MRTSAVKTIVFILVAACSVAAFADSMDFGGSILNTTGFGNYPSTAVAGAAPALLQRDTANLWFQASFGGSFLFSAQVGSAFVMDQFSSRPLFFYVDADLLNLAGSYSQSPTGAFLLRYAFGRMPFSDFTGLVLNQKADGIMLGVEIPALSARVSAAYTGLVSKGASSIALSRNDVNDVSNPLVYFAPPRLIETVGVSILDILGQKLTVSGAFQQDLRDTLLDLASPATDLIAAGTTAFDPSRGGPVYSEYFGLGLDGTIVSTLSYTLYSYLGLTHDLVYTAGSYQSSLGVSVLAGVGVSYFMENALFSRIGAKFLFVSGDPGATSVYESNTQAFSLFTPISRTSLGYVFSPQLSNIMRAELGYSLKPLSFLSGDLGKSLETSIKADVYLRPTPGAISESGVDSANTDLYLGTEADLSVNFRPLSDLGLTLWGGVFFPGSAFGAAPSVQYRAGFDISLSF
jgi:hypothetical protein